jgi:hypothetical protein
MITQVRVNRLENKVRAKLTATREKANATHVKWLGSLSDWELDEVMWRMYTRLHELELAPPPPGDFHEMRQNDRDAYKAYLDECMEYRYQELDEESIIKVDALCAEVFIAYKAEGHPM